MFQEILLLTKSKKNNGLCVAGINKHNGEWVRLTIIDEDSVPIDSFRYPDGSVPELLDTIVVDVIEKCPTELHPEDVYYDPTSISKKPGDDTILLDRQIRKDMIHHEFIYYNDDHRLYDADYPDTGKEGAYSLIAIIPEKLIYNKVNNKKIHASFIYNNHQYMELRVTDKELMNRFEKYRNNSLIEVTERVCLIISLGEKFHNNVNGEYEYYKLVAGVINMDDVKVEEINRSGNSLPEDMSASDFLECIISGKDPFTGQPIEDNCLLQNDIIKKACLHELQLVDTKKTKKRPANAGASWTEEEDLKLVEEFNKGMTISEIASVHERTTGAIRARLIRRGLIEA